MDESVADLHKWLETTAPSCKQCLQLLHFPSTSQADSWSWRAKVHFERCHGHLLKPLADQVATIQAALSESQFADIVEHVPYSKSLYGDTAVEELQDVARSLFNISPDDRMLVLYYTIAIRKARQERHPPSVLSTLYSNRCQVQINIKNFKLALEDARTSAALDPSNHKASYREVRCLQLLGSWAECDEACLRVLRADGLQKAHASCQAILADVALHCGATPSRQDPALPPSVVCGGPQDGISDDTFFDEKSKLMIAKIANWRHYVEKVGKVGDTMEGLIRNAEILKCVADGRFDLSSGAWNNRVQSMHRIGEDLFAFLNDGKSKFSPSELLPSILEQCSEEDCEWWWTYMHQEVKLKGNWSVSALDVWNHVPALWRLKSMKAAFLKICKEVDGLEFLISNCPEIHIAQLQSMASSPNKFLDLARTCAVEPGDTGDCNANRFGHTFVPILFRHAEVNRTHNKAFSPFAKIALEQNSSAVDWVVANAQHERWTVLVSFCYFALALAKCMDEEISIVVSKDHPPERPHGGLKVHGTPFCRQQHKHLKAAVDDPYDVSVYSKACNYCWKMNCSTKCERCKRRLKLEVYYCSQQCQQQDWSTHKQYCGKSCSPCKTGRIFADEHAKTVQEVAAIIADSQASEHETMRPSELLAVIRASRPDLQISLKRLKQILKSLRLQSST